MHDVSAVPTPLPRLHAAIAPIQGRIRTVPEDFRVEEIPAYEPSGAGEHLFVHLEKRGRGTPEVVRDLERALGLERRAGSWAGLKDRWAVTRQWISLLGADPEALASVSIEGVTLLGSCRHGKKLKAGHLRGNRFTLRVRGLPADRLEDAAQILDGLVRDGLPNYFGAQRFGRDRDNASRARAWLIGGGRAPRDSFKRRLWVSSLQSELFNEWLGSRIRGGFPRALPGDLMRKEETGGLFIAEQMPIEQARM
ncbi:MAG: tRNA pseudouridine(13) synthase TruD, partial [Myxococcales bacterium]|nr:tRNA pseudouridine(13) synthase TruD [Myxococcales bacterium]